MNAWFATFEAFKPDKPNYDVELHGAKELAAHGKRNFENATAVLAELGLRVKASNVKWLQQLSPKDQADYRRLKAELDDLQEEIAKIRQEFNPNNLYSVVPLIVVRGGSVLLLIFLTQILLAAYRYNTMLSTYYSAIADALRMTQRSDIGVAPDVEEFLKLLSHLHPKDASYTPPVSPAEHIVALATKAKG